VLQAAVASGFANNTTLCELEVTQQVAVVHRVANYMVCELDLTRQAGIAPLLTALQDHPKLQKIRLDYVLDLSGLEVLLRSQDSKVNKLILDRVGTRTVGLEAVMQELGRNTTVTSFTICGSTLSRENVQQLKFMLRRNTALTYLDLTSNSLGSAGMAEIASTLYRHTSIKALNLAHNDLNDIESANVLRELMRRNKTITKLCIGVNFFGSNIPAVRIIAEGFLSNTTLEDLQLQSCGLDDQGISILANSHLLQNRSLNLENNHITSVGVRALVDDAVGGMNTSLAHNPVGNEGAAILADALGHNAMPSIKRLVLDGCGIDDEGFVALVSALEMNERLLFLSLEDNEIGERGFLALARSLPNIKGLQRVDFTANETFASTLPLLMEGFRKNTSLADVNIVGFEPGDWSQEMKFLGQRNRFTPLLKTSDPTDIPPRLGIWSRALGKVAKEPDVLFYALRSNPKLVGSAAGDSRKRKRDGDDD
jgi:Ran GTPase-activating protein (RanGAP) involved in mRNA processing and transport